MGNIELIGEDIEGKTASEDTLLAEVHEITRAGLQGRSLIRKLLAFTRRSPNPDREEVLLKSVIADVVQMLKSTVPKQVTISQFITSETCILADYTQMFQVIINLCINAVQAMVNMKSGDITIGLQDCIPTPEFLSAHPELQPGQYVKLTISDTGPGIDQLVMTHIFEPFFTTRPRGEGTGMGLSVVQNIIRSHGGIIASDSNLAQDSNLTHGTRFTIYLPAEPCQ